MSRRKQPQPQQSEPSRRPFLLLGAIVLLSLGLNFYNLDFPHGYHADEPKKVRFILNAEQDFMHPILLLDLGRLGLALTGGAPERAMIVGRTVSAICGSLAVLLLYFIAARSLGSEWALLAAFLLAISPIHVIHSHYFKEDALFVAAELTAFLALMRFFDEPSRRRAVLAGIAMGVVTAAQYKAVLLWAAFGIAFTFVPRERRRRSFAAAAPVFPIALAVFLLINYPILIGARKFVRGVSFETRHLERGHDAIPIGPLETFFTFHITQSILPGMTVVAGVAALAAVLVALFRWKRLVIDAKLMLLFLGLSHFAIELTPTKPFPDFMRYTMPEIPLLIYFLCLVLEEIAAMPGAVLAWVRRAAVAAICAVPLWTTVHLDYYLSRDTRAIAEERIAGRESVVADQYALNSGWSVINTTVDRLRRAGVRWLVVSSFEYDRFELAARLRAPQSERTLRRIDFYETLFRFPYEEIRPAYRSFAFSNPTIRIIDLR